VVKTEKVTDPYRPSIWATPSNDIPFIVKGREKFPARREKSRLSNQAEPASGV
jgi:hypothetical protein